MIFAIWEKQKRSKIVGGTLLFANVGGSYREAIPYFTNIIIKQLIHCDKVILKVLHENNRTSMMTACMVKVCIALQAIKLLLILDIVSVDGVCFILRCYVVMIKSVNVNVCRSIKKEISM